MPSVGYYNQTAPFWDFVANLEEQGASHPLFGGRARAEGAEHDNGRPNPWGEGWTGFPWGPFPHRGRHGPPPSGPPPAQHEGAAPPPAAEGESDPDVVVSDDNPEGPSTHHGRHDRHHGRHGPGRGRHGMGPRGGHCGRGRGRAFHPYAMNAFGGLAEAFQNQFFHNQTDHAQANDNEDFTPEADVFDTPEAFVVHVSLPGAKKEDIAVNWNMEKSELSIAGVVHRPGDEELLKTLSMKERRVGAFDRKIRLGSRANPAQVDIDAISARMEDGVLRVEVPKLDAGYVEIKKVDIE